MKHGDIPRPAIRDVLRLLTGEDVAEGFGWKRISCPFHEDRTPSASVNTEVNGFACHSCGRSGDGLKLLMSELRLSFREACDKARELGGEQEHKRPKRRPSDLLRGIQ